MSRFAVRDLISGSVVIAVGGAFACGALGLKIGTVVNMGSGYFPLIAAIVAILLGAAIVFSTLARRALLVETADGGDEERADAAKGSQLLAWRAAIAVLGGVAAFAFCLPVFGFVPAVFACALLSANADPQMRLVESLVIAVAMAGMSWLVFLYGLGVAAPAFVWSL